MGCSSPAHGRWARRWIDHLSPWRMAIATPDLRLPSQTRSITAFWPIPNYTAWWQRHMCVNNLPKVVTRQCPGAASNPRPWVTSGLQVWHVTVRLPGHTEREDEVALKTLHGRTHACTDARTLRWTDYNKSSEIMRICLHSTSNVEDVQVCV